MREGLKTLLDVLKASEKILKEKGIESPRLNAELLLADTLRSNRINLYLEFERILTEAELEDFRAKIRRRLKREPLQYITGNTEFYGLKLTVNKNVLIPRQETEILAENAIAEINEKKHKNILEIGTGSGCISIAIAKNSDCVITATDISSDALVTAVLNAADNNVQNINFIQKDILKDTDNFDGYELVISNPPYIPKDIINTLEPEVKEYEPLNALTDNEDGLKFYKKITELAKKSSPGIVYMLETGDESKQYIEELLKSSDIKNYIFYKDLIGIDRVVRFTI